MDIISRAIAKQLDLYDNSEMERQTWDAFAKCVIGKKLFLFGIGEGMGYFLRNCCNNIDITGVVDNNLAVQGECFGEYCAEAWGTKYENIVIESPDIISTNCKEDIVVLVTSVNFYRPMVWQIRESGIKYCYVLLMLEANKRKALTENMEEDFERIYSEYIEWCCGQRIEEKKIIMLIGIYGSHARQITKALLRRRDDLDLVWLVNDMRVEKPDGVRLVYQKNWRKYIYEMETAKVWIFDDIISPRIKKRDAQIYIQVKHWSSITLKKFYLEDKSPVLTPEAEEAIKYDGARMDYLFSGSRFDEDSFKKGVRFQGKNVRVGSPRSDILFDEEIKKKVIKQFGLKDDIKICLYVPTYRLNELKKNGSMTISLDMCALLKALSDKWECEWFVLVRLHPGLHLGENELLTNQRVLDAGWYPESEELVAASDVMITDYSSIMFEEAYREKPVFLYAPDKKEYIDGERGFLIDYDTLPFPVAESNEMLHREIRDFNMEKYKEELNIFLDRYGVHEDGHASDRAAKFIEGLL